MSVSEKVSFGKLLRQYRLDAVLTQEALAERAGLSVRAISDLERGVRNAPRRDTVRLLADTLGLDADCRLSLENAAIRPRRLEILKESTDSAPGLGARRASS